MLRRVSARTYERLDRLGFIANEIKDAALASFANLTGTANYSSSRENEDEREILTLDYARLSCVLSQCTRSLLARVEALEARLAQ